MFCTTLRERYTRLVQGVLTYGTETWAIKKAYLQSLERTDTDAGEMDVRGVAEG